MNCKKLVYMHEGSTSPSILLGIITHDGTHLIKFKTANRDYFISKSMIKEVLDTDVEFKRRKK